LGRPSTPRNSASVNSLAGNLNLLRTSLSAKDGFEPGRSAALTKVLVSTTA
jgi:hypothetical protein